jgi:acyl carrier protein phosphodiesterase
MTIIEKISNHLNVCRANIVKTKVKLFISFQRRSNKHKFSVFHDTCLIRRWGQVD